MNIKKRSFDNVTGISENFRGPRYPWVPKNLFLAGTQFLKFSRYLAVHNFLNLPGTRYPIFNIFPVPGSQIFKISMGTGVPLAPTPVLNLISWFF